MQVNIRQFKEDDAQALQNAILESVEHLSRWLAWCTKEYSIDDAIEWTKSSLETWEAGTDYRFVIEDSESLEFLGTVGINQIVPQHKIGNLGYWIRKSVTNKGICTYSARFATKFAFEKLDFQRIEVHAQIDNKASNAVASKLGGKYEGIFRNKIYFKGKSLPAKCYSIIPSDYKT